MENCNGEDMKQRVALKPMDAEQLREYGHKVVDFVADYYKSIESFPVLSQVKPGYLKEILPQSAPSHPEPLEDVLNDLQHKIVPGVTHWQSPNYFAYFPSNSSTAGFLGEMLSAGFNIVGFSWLTSPAATELEVIVMDWLAKMLELPEQFLSSGKSLCLLMLSMLKLLYGNGGGVIQGTASEAVLVALLAARDRTLRRDESVGIDRLVVYGSDQTHSALKKACQLGISTRLTLSYCWQIAGIHPKNCRLLPTSSSTNYAFNPKVLSGTISEDSMNGLCPFFLCATVGTTSSTAVDPLPALGKIAKDNKMWFHVDAAYAGSACICPEYRHYLDGVEEADSFNMNAHKWLLTNFDCSALWVKDSSSLVQALSTNPEFLKNKVSEEKLVIDYKDWQVPLGRRFRSLKLWMVMRLYGSENLQNYIRGHIKLAEYFEQLLVGDPRFKVVAPRTFALVCFRLEAPKNSPDNGDKLNRDLLEAVNSSGDIFLSHTVLSGQFILRFAVGAPLTEERHIKAAWKLLQEKATLLLEHDAL
ncbi:Tyrosine decarboxylase 1 [Nymphaea thermarum]|nr:Tyrosine decarboxylase 1 [Nymphaea thermarum]